MDGILNVYKPPGMTSHDVVDYLRCLTAVKRAGHTGTLDPGAAGVLVVCLGKATRIIQYLPDDKAYRAQIAFGVATTTGDSFGEVVDSRGASALTRDELIAAIKLFEGKIRQIPPMTSAVRHQGKRLYELARQGLVVERKPREVFIDRIDLIDVFGLGTRTPGAVIELSCSAGTYVRTLCADLGEKLGCGAHMSFLLRTRVGPFTLEKSLTLERIAQLHRQGSLPAALVGLPEALTHLPSVQVKPAAVARVRAGSRLYPAGIIGSGDHIDGGQRVKLLAGRDLLAVAEKRRDEKGKDFYQPLTVVA